ncbi:predicted protein [Naegleria gruberi]|uniref:Predicted protein n=1 Tax=Naegleria gruberi TaxID=5762 RepID=D2VUS2_NAEGR|nr:uncharacterized protein NAEGRDRAFT_72764 [Naegleria gruberi]EFC39376.1 predicted protein [Naegleria gruberi]|eukprot:XP_002672120.1 predicted protein [Naegleria gruberi strain NEG-M]
MFQRLKAKFTRTPRDGNSLVDHSNESSNNQNTLPLPSSLTSPREHTTLVMSNSSTAIMSSATINTNYNSTNNPSTQHRSISDMFTGNEVGAFNTFNIQQQHDATKTRLLFANDEMSNATNKFIDNSITTTKYTFYNFLFKNLYEQFHRFANCYFLFMAVLQTIPTLSPTGQFTAFFPLAFVLICTMIKDAYEDIKRLYSDRVTNNRIAHVLRGDKFEDIFWKDVKTGDIVKVDNKEPFPCDLILVSSSESQGLCYVETSSLDGETNLKIKRCRHETLELSTPEALDKTRMIVECEKPNNRLYKFEGTMVLSNGKKLSIDTEQICLRGSSLKNTDFMIAVMDRDVSADVAEKFPELYYQGQKNRFFNAKVFISWVVNSLFHSLVCFFVPYYCLVDSKFLDGHDIDPETIGIVIYSCVLVVISLKLCIETSSWTWVNVLIYTGSLLSWPAFIFVYGSIYYIFGYPYPVISEFYGITERWRIFLTPQFYMIVLLVTFMCCIRDIFWKGFVRMRSRNAYYQIQGRKKSKKSRQEILENFPFEEGLPVKMKKKKKFNVVELQEIKKVFETAVTSVAKFNYRGFAFSQTEQQGDFLKQYYNGTSSTNNNNNGNNTNTTNNTTTTTTTSNTGMNTLPNSANDNVIINISNDDIITSKEE